MLAEVLQPAPEYATLFRLFSRGTLFSRFVFLLCSWKLIYFTDLLNDFLDALFGFPT